MHFSLFKFTLVLNSVRLFWKLLALWSLLSNSESFLCSVFPAIKNRPSSTCASAANVCSDFHIFRRQNVSLEHIVTCYCEVSLATSVPSHATIRIFWWLFFCILFNWLRLRQHTIIAYATMDTERDVFYGYEIVVCGLLLTWGVSTCWEIARKGPIERVSCGSRELLQWTVKTVDRRG
jgi:hypothetical protein